MSKTLFITCAALSQDVKTIIEKNNWDADVQAINASLHLNPTQIPAIVDQYLEKNSHDYEKQIVVYGHCGAFGLDEVLEKHNTTRTLGPHCYEMYGSETFTALIKEEPGSYFLTDFLVRTWDTLVIRTLKLDQYPKLKKPMFSQYRRMVYLSQQKDDALIQKAHEIAEWLELPLVIRHVGLGDLEKRLAAIMTGNKQPISAMTLDGYSLPYPTLANGERLAGSVSET
jgi:hypothetical protein